jgi:hypothetical protein
MTAYVSNEIMPISETKSSEIRFVYRYWPYNSATYKSKTIL